MCAHSHKLYTWHPRAAFNAITASTSVRYEARRCLSAQTSRLRRRPCDVLTFQGARRTLRATTTLLYLRFPLLAVRAFSHWIGE